MTSLDELQTYVEGRGWWVFPIFKIQRDRCACGSGALCDAPGKHPMVKGGVKVASFQRQRIIDWFVRFPDCNWAVATGDRSDVWVLDIDAHGVDGAGSMRAWLDENGVTLPDTFTVRTGGGGWHYYFKADQPMKNKTGILPGVDVRADGGYVLLPGSSHISGDHYEVVRDVPVATAPPELVAFVHVAGSSGRGSESGVSAPRGSSLKPLAHYLEHGFSPGSRDIECYDLACSLWRKNWNDPQFVEAAIADCWRATSQEGSPFPWSQARHKIRVAREFVAQSIAGELAFLHALGGAA